MWEVLTRYIAIRGRTDVLTGCIAVPDIIAVAYDVLVLNTRTSVTPENGHG